jgi:hypothetical protein
VNVILSSELAISDPPYRALSASIADPTAKRIVDHLRAHPDFTKHFPGYSTAEVSILAGRGESAFADPLIITQDDYVVEGYALWQLAKLQKRQTIRCIVREMSKEEALLHIIDRNRGSKGINDYVRILLAFELERWFKERAKQNQQIGGRDKGSSQLTEADRLDVRLEIGRAAGVSVGNVSKVKHIIANAIPDLQDCLRLGEISINCGASWASLSPGLQRSRLADGRNRKGIQKTINTLLKKHQPTHPRVNDGLRDIQRGLRKLQHEECLSPLLDPIDRIVRAIDPLLAQPEDVYRAT